MILSVLFLLTTFANTSSAYDKICADSSGGFVAEIHLRYSLPDGTMLEGPASNAILIGELMRVYPLKKTYLN